MLGVMSSKWKWSVRANPLRANDGSRYNQVSNILEAIGNNKVEKRRRTQESYRDRRPRRMDIDYRAISGFAGYPVPYQD